jgi:hypothetical protein
LIRVWGHLFQYISTAGSAHGNLRNQKGVCDCDAFGRSGCFPSPTAPYRDAGRIRGGTQSLNSLG